uniref:Rad60/SUMO-like domain-containing protein n=1 Tax=Sarcophilus harrisii TaxID=9305 RepID=A0A7N4PT05_SARHA
MAKKKPKQGVKTENDHLNLKVPGQDDSVVQFKIKRHTLLSKLMKAYCKQHTHLQRIKIQSIYSGSRQEVFIIKREIATLLQNYAPKENNTFTYIFLSSFDSLSMQRTLSSRQIPISLPRRWVRSLPVSSMRNAEKLSFHNSEIVVQDSGDQEIFRM